MKLCDLHTHSVFSDGSYSPSQAIFLAEAKGLCAIALTDHNTLAGLPEFMSAAKDSSVEAIAGAEFSVDWEGTELHLLGLYLPESSFSPLESKMKQVQQRKEESNRYMIEALARDGMILDYDAIKARNKGYVNRFHIAIAMAEKGYAATAEEAFRGLLAKGGPYYREPERLRALDMIHFIRELGGVPVLAHPFLNLSEEQLCIFLPLAKQAGLAGMECLYSEYSPEETALSFSLAERFGLLPSGGSDWHGATKPHISLGFGTGALRIPLSFAEDLKGSSL